MITGRPSRTALGAALYRAAHQLVDAPLVFVDPLALPLVGVRPGDAPPPELLARLAAEAVPLRAFIAVRSRRAEDLFAAAYARGTRQYVVLGAGLDTFAYRCALPDVAFFEVDHPATQAWKRSCLAAAGIAVPPGVVFAPVDFEREALATALDRAGLDRGAAAFVAWLGVTPYLTPEAVRETLAFVARDLGPGSEILFDFAAPVEEARRAAVRAAFAARVGAAGEPLRSEFEPATLLAEVRALGFSEVAVEDAAALHARYLDGRADGLRLSGGHLLWAARGAHATSGGPRSR